MCEQSPPRDAIPTERRTIAMKNSATSATAKWEFRPIRNLVGEKEISQVSPVELRVDRARLLLPTRYGQVGRLRWPLRAGGRISFGDSQPYAFSARCALFYE